MMVQQDQQISEAIEREKPRLRNFIRKRVGWAASVIRPECSAIFQGLSRMSHLI